MRAARGEVVSLAEIPQARGRGDQSSQRLAAQMPLEEHLLHGRVLTQLFNRSFYSIGIYHLRLS